MPSQATIKVEYERPGRKLQIARAKVPQAVSAAEKPKLIAGIKHELERLDAVLVAHYYVDRDLQDLALQTGGCVADSLEMARFGRDHAAKTLVVAGVRFMGETAKILNPEKRVLMPDLEAECSLDLGCPIDEFSQFCDQHADRVVVVYANTSAAVKARSDWVVTSSIAERIVTHLHAQGKKILFAPDKHLGEWIQSVTGADMIMWQGACVVHDEFKGKELAELKAKHPQAKVLAHPESPDGVLALADVVASTTGIIKAAQAAKEKEFIVATDKGIFHKLKLLNPGKNFIEAPTAGKGATCKSCAACPWMAMNGLKNLLETLRASPNSSGNEVHVDPAIGRKAKVAIQRMVDFADQYLPALKGSGDA
jgi:quinolinate synthase